MPCPPPVQRRLLISLPLLQSIPLALFLARWFPVLYQLIIVWNKLVFLGNWVRRKREVRVSELISEQRSGTERCATRTMTNGVLLVWKQFLRNEPRGVRSPGHFSRVPFHSWNTASSFSSPDALSKVSSRRPCFNFQARLP